MLCNGGTLQQISLHRLQRWNSVRNVGTKNSDAKVQYATCFGCHKPHSESQHMGSDPLTIHEDHRYVDLWIQITKKK